MKKIIFNVFCSGVYQSELEVEDDFCGDNIEEMDSDEIECIRRYVCQNLDLAPLGEIEWIADIDIESDDIVDVRKID